MQYKTIPIRSGAHRLRFQRLHRIGRRHLARHDRIQIFFQRQLIDQHKPPFQAAALKASPIPVIILHHAVCVHKDPLCQLAAPVGSPLPNLHILCQKLRPFSIHFQHDPVIIRRPIRRIPQQHTDLIRILLVGDEHCTNRISLDHII